MFESFRRPRHSIDIDLASVRDTLRYIEGDLGRAPEYAKLAGQIRAALAEIDRLEMRGSALDAPEFQSAQFLPVRM